eukprot:15349360-Ditylum_brightwellii.AAC.1
MCANFKPLGHSTEELVEYLEGVECSENKNPPERSYWNNNFSGLKNIKKSKRNHCKDEEFHNITAKNASNKKSCKLCKIFSGNAESHTTDHCN